MSSWTRSFSVALYLLLPFTASAQLAPRWQAMNQPVEPFRIMGNLYYVGASSVTSFLLTTPEGHVLIDGGFDETVPLIRSGVEKLGFRFEDVKVLLNSHAHFDHAGGLARIREATGARLMASAQDTPFLERGGLDDDLLGDEAPFPAVKVDRRLNHGDVVSLGGLELTALVTAGHTRGCTSWSFEVEDGGRSYRAVSICSLSVLDGMKFDEDPTYPGIAEDFERSFEVLGKIPCTVFLASHAEFFDMAGKRARLGEEGVHPFVDPDGYRSYLERARRRFDQAREAENSSTGGR